MQPSFLHNKTLRSILLIALVLLALVVSLYLVRHQQEIRSRADSSNPLEITTNTDGSVQVKINNISWPK